MTQNFSQALIEKYKPNAYKLVNPNSPIETIVSRITFGIGMKFNRNNQNNKIHFLSDKNSRDINLGLSSSFKLDDPSSFMGMTGFPILSIF